MYFFPNEPVPPVMRMDVLLNMAFSIDNRLIAVRSCHGAKTQLSCYLRQLRSDAEHHSLTYGLFRIHPDWIAFEPCNSLA